MSLNRDKRQGGVGPERLAGAGIPLRKRLFHVRLSGLRLRNGDFVEGAGPHTPVRNTAREI